MRKSTSIFKAVLIALFAVSLGVEMVSAAGFPSVKDLYGRYKFSGECSYVDMVSGVAGEAVKAGSSISSRCIKDVKIYSSDGSIHVDGLEDAEICVFDAQGMLVASAHGATAAFNGLKSGLYLVKFGNQTAKVVVK